MSSTIVSTLPWEVEEEKLTLIPHRYILPAAKFDDISILHVNDAFYYRYIPLSDAPALQIPVPSAALAKSIVDDFVSAMIGVNYTPNDDGLMAVPGLFYLPDKLSVEQIKLKHKPQMEHALNSTKLWFAGLIKMADDEWLRTHQYQAINDIQRRAVKYLGLDREWMRDTVFLQQVNCWSCKTKIHGDAIVCHNCKAVINAVEYAKSKEKFANA